MSNFLFIVPQGWTQLDWDTVTQSTWLTAHAVLNAANSGYLIDVENELKEKGHIPPLAILVEMKVFDDSYFVVRLAYDPV
jgi:hypothetical protein